MNQNSRSSNVLKNIIGGVGGQIFTSILQFVCRTVFISLLGAAYLGVNGLFSNILSMLSLAELGIGPAIVFSMYKPIADNDEVHVAKLMNFYKTAYRMVAGIVLVIGLILTPNIESFINNTTDVQNLKLIFILILLNTVTSYLFAYKGSMLTADQKAYVGVIIHNIFSVVQNIAQIVVLVITGNFILYLVVQIVTTFIGNLALAKYVDKKYPFLITYRKEQINKMERASILQKVKGMMMHKIGGFVLNSTDNLIISKFISVVAVGIYSNYLMIINMVKSYVTQITGSVTASVGNLIASESADKVYRAFEAMQLVYFWLYSFCFTCFYVIFQPFISLWIGEHFLMNKAVLFLVLLNFYLNGYQDCVNTYVNATGLFWETRYKPIIECFINLGVSIILAWKIGLVGVFVGTVASFICTFWVNPIVIYKHYFKRNVGRYFINFFVYLGMAILMALGLDTLLTMVLSVPLFANVIIRIITSLLVPNLILILIFHRSDGFIYCKNLAKSVLTRFTGRKK